MSTAPSDRRPLRRDAERNRQRIVDAARRLVDAQGLAVSHDEIARAAEVGVGTVYRRYPSLEPLFEEIFRDRVEAVLEVLRQAHQQPDPWLGLRWFLFGNCELQVRNRGLDDFLLGSAGGLQHSRDAQARLAPEVGRLVERARRAGAVRPEIQPGDVAVVFALTGTLIEASREVDPNLWRRYLTMLVNGLRPDPGAEELPGSALEQDDLNRVLTRRPAPRRRTGGTSGTE